VTEIEAARERLLRTQTELRSASDLLMTANEALIVKVNVVTLFKLAVTACMMYCVFTVDGIAVSGENIIQSF